MARRKLLLPCLLGLLTTACLSLPVAAKDPLVRGTVLQLLDELGITTNGTYTAPTTTDLTSDQTGVGSITQASGKVIRAGDGTNGAPSLSFAADTDTGIYRSGTNDLTIVTGGSPRLDITSTSTYSSVPFYGPDGLVGSPGFTFNSDPDTGLYRIGANQLGATSAGVLQMTWDNATGCTLNTLLILGSQGVNAPSSAYPYHFVGDGNSGLGQSAVNHVTLTADGTTVLDATDTACSLALPTSASITQQQLNWANNSATKTLTDALCSGQTWTNTGAVAGATGTIAVSFTLPDAPAVGDLVSFVVTDTDGLKVVANTGDTITTEAQVTAAAGYLASTRLGSRLTLRAESATSWYAVDVSGTWVKDNVPAAAHAGFAYTPTAWTALASVVHTWDASGNVTETGSYRRYADMIEISVSIRMTGAPTSAALTIDLPSSIATCEVTGIVAGSDYILGAGIATAFDTSATASYNGPCYVSNSGTKLAIYSQASPTVQWSQAAPFTFATGDAVNVRATYAVVQ
jgi:hypothetical protein